MTGASTHLMSPSCMSPTFHREFPNKLFGGFKLIQNEYYYIARWPKNENLSENTLNPSPCTYWTQIKISTSLQGMAIFFPSNSTYKLGKCVSVGKTLNHFKKLSFRWSLYNNLYLRNKYRLGILRQLSFKYFSKKENLTKKNFLRIRKHN